MQIRQILPSDRRAMAQAADLLEQAGIRLDPHLEETWGIFDSDGTLTATGSAFGPTLRCLAVHPDHRGEGLLNQIVTRLIDSRTEKGYFHLFVYTKPDSAARLRDLGFWPIAEVPGGLTFLENRRQGFARYLESLAGTKTSGTCAALVMNANPFTLGHRYLVERAAGDFDWVHLFVISEAAGPIPAQIRFDLVRSGTRDLPNVILHSTGDYLISRATFPSYFLKDGDAAARIQARLDAALFLRIAETLNVSCRFLGEEPESRVTAIYNQVLAEILPPGGVECRILPRLTVGGRTVSAGAVRRYVREDGPEAAAALLPETTLAYLCSPEAAPVLAAIRAAEPV